MSPDGDDSDVDVPTLAADTQKALREYYAERDSREQQFEALKARAEQDHDGAAYDMDAFGEDWNASQFWYDHDTSTTLAMQLLSGSTADTNIAIVSAPSVFVRIMKILASDETNIKPKITLFEYDDRFGVFDEFVHYDFHQPLQLPGMHMAVEESHTQLTL
ncbi:MAG: hypothetical protein M1817_004200 [Caeruleum heppii]|nr:MAG: hypothetical protein M1817_004200 [Caeruleum heppii]